MTEQPPQELVLTPAQVGERLGIGSPMVRRYGIAYESVTGEGLAPEPNAGRLYPERVVRVLEQARDLVKDTPGLAVDDAIRSVLGLVATPTAPTRACDSSGVTPEHLELIVAELRALRDEVRELRQENHSLHALVESQGEQMKALTPSNDTQPSDKAAYVAEMEQVHADYERRLKYLQGELERRDSALIGAIDNKHKRVPWWRRLLG
jgi:hypothetical protein